LERDLKAVEEGLATIKGEVVSTSTGSYPIIVAVWDADDPTQKVLRFWPMYHPGEFRFVLPAPANYRVLVFEDRNRDFVFQDDEPAAFCQTASAVSVSAGQRLEGLRISLAESDRVDLDYAVDVSSPAAAVTLANVTVKYGELVGIEDARFTQANAAMGLWEPLRFLQEVGAGMYFLEPFDPDKTPIMFVHGLSGHPAQWKDMVAHLDRDHFQPWLFFYPSGASLQVLSDELYRITKTLCARYKFTDMHLVAHSMGGLVARGFLNTMARQESPIKIPLFVTISTPWGGHEATEMGVKYAPAVVPSWLDMLPGSAFQNELWETSLSPETTHLLMFSYRGKGSPFMDRNNDGTVTLSSELDMRAQMAASRVVGFSEDHVSILSSQEVSDMLADSLERWRSSMQPHR
jgi:pimeloyl-ACP methyl ester carboxylesterase